MKYFQNNFIKTLISIIIFVIFFSSFSDRGDAYSYVSSQKSNNVKQKENSPEENTVQEDSSELSIFTRLDSTQIETFTITMPQLGSREKTIVVNFPPDYSISGIAYPVIYLNNAEEVFIHIDNENEHWLLNESLYQFYTSEFKREVIIVGINSDSIYFWEEYGPWVNDNMYLWMEPYDANRVEGGKGNAYLDFLIHTLKPEIDSRYRTIPDRENTAIAGYGMGGLISIYAGVTRSMIYSEVMAISPAVWFAEDGGAWLTNNRLIELIAKKGVPKNVSYHIDVADSEKTTEIEVRPAVYDSQGKKISFPQAYLQGALALEEALYNYDLQTIDINGGKINLDSLSDPDQSIEEPTSQINYYFPLFMKQGLDHFDIFIPFENLTRQIWVYLPPNYSRETKSYPVVYLPNAQYIFGGQTGANIPDYRDWLFDEKLDEIYSETGKGIIAVGIEYDRRHEWDEYMPWTNYNMDNWLYNVPDIFSGKGNDFLEFIINDLKPVIDSKYRTIDDAENTAICGGSRFALFSLYASLKRPDVFSNVIIFSPTVWLAEGGAELPLERPIWLTTNNLLKWFDNNQAPKNVNYYLYTGTDEVTGPPEPFPHVVNQSLQPIPIQTVYLSGARTLKTKLENEGIPSGNFKYVENPGGKHIPLTWRNYIKTALEWFGFN